MSSPSDPVLEDLLAELEGSDLRHLSMRAAEFGLGELEEALLSAGWLTEIERVQSSVQSDEVMAALRELGQVPRLAESCQKHGCETCQFIADSTESRDRTHPWQLRFETYRWQKEAANAWFEHSGRGIVKVVTGAGKTVLALSLVSKLANSRAYEDGGLRVVIVVPTTALLDQWHEEIRYLLNLADDDIGNYYASRKDVIGDKPVCIYVLPSAAKYLPRHVDELEQDEDVFLIVDECHRSGSQEYSKIFHADYAHALGLSATPERRGDFGYEDILIPQLGPVIYEYGYEEALSDRIIPPFRLKRIAVKLHPREAVEYERLTDEIREIFPRLTSKYPELKSAGGEMFLKVLGRLQRETADPLIERYTALLNLRKAIVHTSRSKMRALAWIIENELPASAKTLVFHERIASAEQIERYLLERGLAASSYHSGMEAEDRKASLRHYREDQTRILVTCRALDEGLDVPSTSAGILVASTSSIRQHVQRMGRILRRAPGKDHSLVYSIYVDGIEDEIFSEEVMQELEQAAERVEYISLS